MRVAVHHPERKEGEETIPASVSAFRLGRITDLVDPLSGETTPAEQVVEKLSEEAAREFPDCEIVVERLVDNGDETSSWVRVEDVPEGATSPDGTTIQGPELVAEQPQAAGGAA
jgi:hypothetical protein